MTKKNKIVIIISMFILFGLLMIIGIVLSIQSENINKKFENLELEIRNVEYDVIFNNDIFFDYELSKDLEERCSEFSCFLMCEVFDEQRERFIPYGSINDISNKTQTGSIVFPVSKYDSFDSKENLQMRLLIENLQKQIGI